MLKRGKKTREWENLRRKLKVRFANAGITECEFRFCGCWRNFALSFAHAMRRRFCGSQQDLQEVALACGNCHNILDNTMDHEQTAIEIRSVIKGRKIQP